jgi:hypothetical protein
MSESRHSGGVIVEKLLGKVKLQGHAAVIEADEAKYQINKTIVGMVFLACRFYFNF